MTRMYSGAALLAWMLSAATGCGTDLEPPVVATVTVTPGAATLAFLGESAAFTATATDQYGNPFAGTVAWTSDAPNVFTVSPAGVATAVSNGAGTIRAQVDGVSGTATVTVSQKPTAVERAAGDAQRGRPGTPLVKPLIARVLDAGGSPVAGTAVFFSPADGSGLVAPGTAPTDMAGEARASWTLGDGFGPQSLVASVADGANTVFTATAQRPNELADSVRVVSGDGQAARPGKGLRSPIVVRVLDEHGAPVEGATVRFETPLGHGLADPDSVRSDHQGEAATTWTLGEKVGLQLLTASVPGGPGVRLKATASLGVCERTPQVRDALVEAAGVTSCDEVTDAVLSEIPVLHLQSKGIEILDEDDFAGLSNLEVLSLAGNKLAELPLGLFAGLSKLRNLWLSGNQLVDLPTGVFAELSSLKALSLGENRLKLQTDVFAGLTSLQSLELQNNQLTELAPGLLSGMPSLGSLRLDRNRLATVPSEELSRLINLSTLNLSDNDIADLSFGAFAGLSNLHTLYLDRNQLAEVSPGAFEDLSNLRELQLTENRLTDLPVGIFAGLANLVLHLSGNPLDLRPGVFSGLSDVSLVLRDIQLTHLRSGVFAGVPNLQLTLDQNRLDLRPGVFAGLSNLTGLALRENELIALPVGVFTGLSNLERLSLTGNQLAVLPAGLFVGLSNLESLDLTANQLTDLPIGAFAGLSKLERLYLGRNQLAHLDGNLFGALQDLRRLVVWYNQLAALSANQFSGLEKLWMLRLDGNPGSPFPLRLQIERTDTTELAAPGPATMVVRLDEGAPFDMQVTLSAPGATLSPATAIISTGGTRSNVVTATPNTGTGGSVTVSMGDPPRIPEKVCPPEEQGCKINTYTGFVVIAGDPIVIF